MVCLMSLRCGKVEYSVPEPPCTRVIDNGMVNKMNEVVRRQREISMYNGRVSISQTVLLI